MLASRAEMGAAPCAYPGPVSRSSFGSESLKPRCASSVHGRMPNFSHECKNAWYSHENEHNRRPPCDEGSTAHGANHNLHEQACEEPAKSGDQLGQGRRRTHKRASDVHSHRGKPALLAFVSLRRCKASRQLGHIWRQLPRAGQQLQRLLRGRSPSVRFQVQGRIGCRVLRSNI